MSPCISFSADDVDRTSGEEGEGEVTDVAAAIAAAVKRQSAAAAVPPPAAAAAPGKRLSFKNVFRRSMKRHQGWTDYQTGLAHLI